MLSAIHLQKYASLQNIITFNGEKNLLSHYTVHYTMHIVMENRNEKNFLCILCANLRSKPHGILHITPLAKTSHYLSELCLTCSHSRHSFS